VKRCCHCKQYKAASEFWKNQRDCKDCLRAYRLAQLARDPEGVRARASRRAALRRRQRPEYSRSLSRRSYSKHRDRILAKARERAFVDKAAARLAYIPITIFRALPPEERAYLRTCARQALAERPEEVAELMRPNFIANLAERERAQILLRERVAALAPFERRLVWAFYGLEGYTPSTAREIAARQGHTYNVVRAALLRARKKLGLVGGGLT